MNAKTDILRQAGKSLWLTVLALMLLPLPSQARQRTENEVRAAAQTWVRHVTADPRTNADIERMEPYFQDARLVGYIAHLKGGGFCLCGADDRLLPVYVYNPADAYDPANPSHRYVLAKMAEYLSLASGQPGGAPAKPLATPQQFAARAADWEELIAGRTPTRPVPQGPLLEPNTAPAQMSLPLTSRWHQDPPYNDQCPVLTPPAEHTVVGCVATAMSQIMYYWKWPPSGVGSNSVTYHYRWSSTWRTVSLAGDPGIPPGWAGRLQWTSSPGYLWMTGYWDDSLYASAQAINASPNYLSALATLWNAMTPGSQTYSANFAATTYQWSLMHDDHNNPPNSGDAAVAELCFHAGVSVNMQYGVSASAASTGDARNAFVSHWRYDSDATFEDRNNDRMTEDIQWLRPVQLRGCDPSVGCHSWVVMGYNMGTDPNRQFLMNIGWGGSPEWHTCDSFFPTDQQHTTRIAPQNVVKFVGAGASGDGSPSAPYRDLAQALQGAPSGAALVFKAGSVNPAAPITISKPLTLKGVSVSIGS
jgi:hypothetical protein